MSWSLLKQGPWQNFILLNHHNIGFGFNGIFFFGTITVGELFNGKTFFGTIKTLECESMVKLSLEPKQLDLVKHTYLFRTINTRIRVQGFGQWILETMQIYPTSFRQTKQMKCSKIKNDLDNKKQYLEEHLVEMVLVVMVNIRRKPPLARKEWFATNAQYIMCIYIMKINISIPHI